MIGDLKSRGEWTWPGLNPRRFKCEGMIFVYLDDSDERERERESARVSGKTG